MAIGWWILQDKKGNPCSSYRHASWAKRDALFTSFGAYLKQLRPQDVRVCKKNIAQAYLVWQEMRKLQKTKSVDRGEMRFHWFPRGNFVITPHMMPARTWDHVRDAYATAERLFAEQNPERARPWLSPASPLPAYSDLGTPTTAPWVTPLPAECNDFEEQAESSGHRDAPLPVFGKKSPVRDEENPLR